MRYLLIIALCLGIFGTAFSQNGDINLLRKINVDRNKSLDPTFRFFTKSLNPMMIAVPVGFITACFITKNKKTREKTIVICSSLIIAGALTTVMKRSVNRKRPFITYPDIEKATPASSPSFPSGHASGAFSLATSLSLVCPKWYVIAPSFLWASTVAYSRMDLGVHYPTDVLVGALVGSGSAYLSYKLNKWYLKRKLKSSSN